MAGIFQTIESYLFAENSGRFTAQVITIAIALIICFFGYRTERLWAALIGFFTGAFAGGLLADHFFDNEILTLILSVVAGFFVAMLSYHIYSMGLFMFCLFCGALLGARYLPLLVADPFVANLIALGAGIILAVLAIIFLKPAVIILTAAFGGLRAAECGAQLLPIKEPWVFPALAGGLVLVGGLIQFLTTRNYSISRGGDRISKY